MGKRLGLVLIVLLLAGCGGFWSNRLPYAGPVQIDIPEGEFLPGTGIQYLGSTGQGAQLIIDGKQTDRKVGDSLSWKDDMVRGVSVDQTLRVTGITEDTLQTAGTVRIIVRNPHIQSEAPDTSALADASSAVHFSLPVGYHVDKGTTIPGTTINFLGKTEEGAHLGNFEGDAYRKVGDPITWQGRLRPGVWLELNLRTDLITDDLLDVVGTADLWIAPAGD
jgi:hypothetical protein